MTEGATFEHEFNRLAQWTAEAIESGAAGDAIPGACNGSGSPASLAWLADALRIGPSTRLIDTGAGLGGPAAWFRQRCACPTFVAEPMAEAAAGARRLFGLPAVVAWAHQLPLAAASFDAALALAVLSTAEDKDGYLREVRRTLRPGGGLGVLEYVVSGPLPDATPANNDLLHGDELDRLLASAGFETVAVRAASSLPDPPAEWTAAEERIKTSVAAAHRGDPVLDEATRQEERFGRLLADGVLSVRLVHATAV
jgi:SAM-dependent methyltransferase